ncbi:MAG: hypothetical protein A2173_05140 [Planctomycetes bacterium RBG_13_44_8b]|nr:MAG: hypothetical protein A2173_05140 [Planctomycetes bacterium RBG_13_44_8b]
MRFYLKIKPFLGIIPDKNRIQKTGDRRRKTDDGRRRTDHRRQMTEDGSQKQIRCVKSINFD